MVDIIYLARHHWPLAKLKLTTNGFFLHRHEFLPEALEKNKCKLSLSIHHNSKEYNKKISAIINLIENWKSKYTFESNTNESYKHWTRRYQDFGSKMRPYFHENARKSWMRCPAKYCKQLYAGFLWKCPPLAYLSMQNKKYSLDQSWDFYLTYKPLSHNCTDEELLTFLELEEEQFCEMCPADSLPFDKPNPMKVIKPTNFNKC